jgi:hypothetical protein
MFATEQQQVHIFNIQQRVHKAEAALPVCYPK